MDQGLQYVMTAFVIIAAISMVLQVVYLVGMYRAVRGLRDKVTALLPKVESLVDASQKVVADGRQQILEVTAKTNEILDSTKRQLVKIEDVVNDATGRAKVQLEHAEMVLDDTMTRAHDTIAGVHRGLMRPVREIHGVAAGIRALLGHLVSGGRTSVAQATQDEEMFI
jgi:hypothetical protein